ncbi:hypothetical protein RFI_15067 [Reticulomyxa filosa]|uniref:Uncharacterized protein n=1 Tax=Reticulomyxa filosa TaxID=46433 RepID=X6N7V2_RETFI|nr:hypothetical protein RFI_15067 [Reticulomyxa filosa]|eukprot:ETO22136.1 hypothetical protein RFI_15067 [Reticulomyxa filosa]
MRKSTRETEMPNLRRGEEKLVAQLRLLKIIILKNLPKKKKMDVSSNVKSDNFFPPSAVLVPNVIRPNNFIPNPIPDKTNRGPSEVAPFLSQDGTSSQDFRVYTEGEKKKGKKKKGAKKKKKKGQEIMENKHRFQLWNVNLGKPIRHPCICHDGYLYKQMGKKTNKAGNHMVYYYCITGKGFDEKYWGDRPKPICKASIGIERDANDNIISIMVKHCHKHTSSCNLFPKEAINWVKPWSLYIAPLTEYVKGFEELWNPDHKRPVLSDIVLLHSTFFFLVHGYTYLAFFFLKKKGAFFFFFGKIKICNWSCFLGLSQLLFGNVRKKKIIISGLKKN